MTATIRPGDLILVHSVHTNGWADGTVLNTGARGWLPTNYCETYDHSYLRNLLNAMTQFWDLLGAGDDANLSTFVRQDYIRGLIAGVRSLLERANCLHRDAPLVQRITAIRRMRKGLLADLSTLVQIAKRLQETISEAYAGDVVHVLLDELVTKAFKVVTRAVGFVDILTHETVETEHTKPNVMLTGRSTYQRTESSKLASNSNASPGRDALNVAESAVDDHTTPAANAPIEVAIGRSNRGDHTEDVDSQPAIAPTANGGLLTHRLSVVKPVQRFNSTLASDQLARAHDECISHIGAFIGLYLHLRPSHEVLPATERILGSCHALLAVVDQVYHHGSQMRDSTRQSRSNFKLKVDELTKSTDYAFKVPHGMTDEVVMLPEQTENLLSIGTDLIRTAGECVVNARKLIEQLGDFDLSADPSKNAAIEQKQVVSGACLSPEQENSSTSSCSSTNEPQVLQTMVLAAPSFPVRQTATSVDVHDFAPHSIGATSSDPGPLSPTDPMSLADSCSHTSSPTSITSSTSPERKGSVGASLTGSTDTHPNSVRDSATTAASVSTRATTPDYTKETHDSVPALSNSFGSLSSLRSTAATEASNDAESQLLQKTYASELMLNKDGQVTGGSLPALVEQLTTHDNAPDPQFLSAFFITFRCFTTARELAQTLIERFDYIGDSKTTGTPVRLRIYNVFKGWVETYWDAEADKDALGEIRFFALHRLRPQLPQAGERLIELTRKVTAGYHSGTFPGPLVSGVGKTSMSIGSQHEREGSVQPAPVITKSQLNALRNPAVTCSITDFDPPELARQLTILASKTFCEIQSEELLSLDWNKRATDKARNVRNMCILNTDLAHVVGDTILGPEDAKKRAAVIKHWSKVAARCLELNNYDSVMAIMCSLNSSVVQRLRRTWEVVSKNTKARLDELNSVVDFSRNHASLRSRLENPVAPCVPFLGVYLTDLTFVDAGNPKVRELPGTATKSGQGILVINFDKHMRMAKIISHVQKFQVPYKLQPIPEMQTWMQKHLERMREGHAAMVGKLHRRSLIIEPKNSKAQTWSENRRYTDPSTAAERPKTAGSNKDAASSRTDGQRFEVFVRTNLNLKGRADLPTPNVG